MLLSCQPKSATEYVNGKQVLSKFDEEQNIGTILKKEGRDSIRLGDELVIYIFSTKKGTKVVNAFSECDWQLKPTVDTTSYKVAACSKPLYVKNDTVIIGFRPTKKGAQSFHEISVLTKNEIGIFQILPSSFDYVVY